MTSSGTEVLDASIWADASYTGSNMKKLITPDARTAKMVTAMIMFFLFYIVAKSSLRSISSSYEYSSYRASQEAPSLIVLSWFLCSPLLFNELTFSIPLYFIGCLHEIYFAINPKRCVIA